MELWDLYDIDRRKTGETHVRGVQLPPERYHMVAHVVIFNPQGQMLIQQRQPFKAGWPDMWDLTVGGSAISGDNSRTAAQREVREEIGLDLDLTGETPKVTIPFDVGFDDIYIVVREVDLTSLTLQESEVQAVRWAEEAEIQRMIRDGTFLPYHPAFISLLFALRNQRGTLTRLEDE